MKKKLLMSLKSGIVVTALLFSNMIMPLAKVQALAGGNNGTLKIHEFGTASGTESNDPKVCIFNLEGFDFDPSQSGYLMLDAQGGSLPLGVTAGPFGFGPTDASGYAQTSYFNSLGGIAITNGTYKVTLYGKDTGGNIDLTDELAKSKVFKVECGPAVALTDVTPAAVTFVDVCETASDAYTIPATTGVLYQLAGVTVPAGTYPGTGTVTITAIPDAGFNLTGTTTWQYTFTDISCPLSAVTPAVPTGIDLTCLSNGTYTIPSSTGVIYKVNGVITAAGTYPVTTAGSITVIAEAAAGFQLTGTTSWTLAFTAPTNCGGSTVIDVCPNIAGVQAVLPTGMIIDSNGDCITPAPGGGTTTTPITPQILATSTSKTSPAEELVNTGNSILLNLVAGLFLITSAAGVSLAGFKHRKQSV